MNCKIVFLVTFAASLQACGGHASADLRSVGSQAIVQTHASSSLQLPPGASADPHVAEGVPFREEVQVPWVTLPFAVVLVCGVVLFIYGPRGPAVVASVLVYLLSLSCMKLSVNWVFETHDFPFAKLVSAMHFATGGVVTFGVLLLRGTPIPQPSMREFCFMISPIAFAMALSIGLNNMALTFSTVAFTEIIGATNCLITIATVVLMGMPFNKWLVAPASIVAFGCALGTVGELNFSLAGFLLCLSSNIFRSLKVTLQQKLMTGESKDKFDPTALLFWISIPSTAVMMAFSLMTEGLLPYTVLASREAAALNSVLLAILVSCANATILNLFQLFVTKDLGAVGGQLVAQAKMILTVLGGMVLFGETFSRLELVGFVIALVGVYSFSRLDQAFKEEEKKRALLPHAKSSASYEAPGKSATNGH